MNNLKCINNYTEDELKSLLPFVPYEKIYIVYEYYHKSRSIKVYDFANKHNISTSTLYRYLNEIKKLIYKTSNN